MPLNVELFVSAGCPVCAKTKKALKEIIEDLPSDAVQWRVFDVVEEIDRAVEAGVVRTPAIIVNGELVLTGLPDLAALRRILERRINRMLP